MNLFQSKLYQSAVRVMVVDKASWGVKRRDPGNEVGQLTAKITIFVNFYFL